MMSLCLRLLIGTACWLLHPVCGAHIDSCTDMPQSCIYCIRVHAMCTVWVCIYIIRMLKASLLPVCMCLPLPLPAGAIQGGPVPADVKAAKLHSSYSAMYNADVGSALQQGLLQRSSTTPYPSPLASALELGQQFRISAYRSLTARLARIMHTMEYNLCNLQSTADLYLRTEHIIQIGGPPGYGKTTAGQLGWVALQQALSSNDSQQWAPADADRACWARLCNRVQASFTPDRMLLFKLDFRTSG